jgi:uncharacterized protein involved in exopolysaccharide biosynthesis
MFKEIPTNYRINEPDEISLVDLVRMLLRRKLILNGVFIVGIAFTVTAILMHEQQYLYAASIEIGNVSGSHGEKVPVETVNAAKARLEGSIIPAVLADYAKINSGTKPPVFTLNSPRNSPLLILQSKGLQTDAGAIVSLENSILAKLKDEQAALYELDKMRVVNELVDKDHQLEEQIALQKSLIAAQERTSKLFVMRTNQLKDAKVRLNALIASRNKLGQGDTALLARLLADAEIEKTQRMVLDLERDVSLELPAMKDNLVRQLSTSKRHQGDIEAAVVNVKMKLENIQETRFINEPGLSPAPTGVSKKAILAVGILLSVLLAIMVVFVAEFITRARVELASRGAS